MALLVTFFCNNFKTVCCVYDISWLVIMLFLNIIIKPTDVDCLYMVFHKKDLFCFSHNSCCISTKQHQASCDPKMQPFCKFGVLVHCLARKCECDRFARFFVAATAKLQKFVISKPNSSPSEQGSCLLYTSPSPRD